LRKGHHPRGEVHWKAKLTEAQAIEVIRLLTEGQPIRAIAKQFSVTHSTIWSIADSYTWRYLPRD
jgi:DNA invertase Pin-like site-specific DNA recombinase